MVHLATAVLRTGGVNALIGSACNWSASSRGPGIELCLLPILFRYCGTACSHADWPKHRNVCKALGQQRLAAKAAAAAAREAA